MKIGSIHTGMFAGVRIVKVPLRLRQRVPDLGPRILCSPEFRREFNQWQRDFFGVIDETILKPGQCITGSRLTAAGCGADAPFLYVRSDDYEVLLRLMEQRNEKWR